MARRWPRQPGAGPLVAPKSIFRSLLVLQRPDATDKRDRSGSRGVPDLGMRMLDHDTPSLSFGSLRTGVTFRANYGRSALFLLLAPRCRVA